LDFVPLLDRIGLPYVVQGHGIDVSAALRKPGMAERYLAYKSARATLTDCEFRFRLIKLGLRAGKIHVNFAGDVPARQPQCEPDFCKRFLAVAYNVPKKGQSTCSKRFAWSRHKTTTISLDIIGGVPLFPADRDRTLNERRPAWK
jgi:hypothetical protein